MISYRGTLRIWSVFVPLWSGRGRAGKKVTAVTFFRCPTVEIAIEIWILHSLIFLQAYSIQYNRKHFSHKVVPHHAASGFLPRFNRININMMTSSNGNIFRVTGHLCRNSSVTGEFPAQKSVTRSFVFSLICAWINVWVNNHEAGDLRRHRGHYDVTVMKTRNIEENYTNLLSSLFSVMYRLGHFMNQYEYHHRISRSLTAAWS